MAQILTILLILMIILFLTVLLIPLLINYVDFGVLLSKIDLKDAFCSVPVQQSGWNLLGIHWKDILWTAFLFNKLADAIHWILRHQYEVNHLR